MDRYIQRCLELADKSSCKKRKYGSVVVKNGEIVGEGFNHPASKEIEKILCNPCIRIDINSGTELEKCADVHAEQAAIIDAYKHVNDLSGTVLYVTGRSPDGELIKKSEKGFYCSFCSRIMAEAGIKEVRFPMTDGVGSLSKGEYLRSSYEFALGKKVFK